jgi:hypothetical protein
MAVTGTDPSEHPNQKIWKGELDAQYPVASATRLYGAVLGGLDDCLLEGTAVFYALPGPLASLPLGVLLKAVPPLSWSDCL